MAPPRALIARALPYHAGRRAMARHPRRHARARNVGERSDLCRGALLVRAPLFARLAYTPITSNDKRARQRARSMFIIDAHFL